MLAFNLTLIGMSGAGKSTVGKILADSLKWKFIDVDHLIEEAYGKPLQTIVDEVGEQAFIELEGAKVAELSQVTNAVIAPGGSIIYSPKAMQLLKGISSVVYLSADSESIKNRIDATSRGIIGLKGKSFANLSTERAILYRQCADMIVETDKKTPKEVAIIIIKFISN